MSNLQGTSSQDAGQPEHGAGHLHLRTGA
jgi:hypothetical protein